MRTLDSLTPEEKRYAPVECYEHAFHERRIIKPSRKEYCRFPDQSTILLTKVKIKKSGSPPRRTQPTISWCGMWKVHKAEEFEALLDDPLRRQRRIREYKARDPNYVDTKFVVTHNGERFNDETSHRMEDWLVENNLAYIRPYVGQFEFWDADTAMQFMLRWGGSDV